MTDSAMMTEAVNAIIVINAAIKNLRLYPSESDIITKAVDKVFDSFNPLFQFRDGIIFAESEKQLLIFGESLIENELKKPQVMSFLVMMLNFGIRSIEFQKGLQKSELMTFLEAVSQKPEEIEKQGGLKSFLEKRNLNHIVLDQKIYVAMDKNKQILASLDLTDEDIVRYIAGESSPEDINLEEIKKLSSNPEWIATVFQSGIKHVGDREGDGKGKAGLSEATFRLINALETITDKSSKKKISEHISGTIADMDSTLLENLLAHNLNEAFDGNLLEHVIEKLDDEKFEALVTTIKQKVEQNRLKEGDSEKQESASTNRSYRMLMGSEKGKRLEERIHKKIDQEKLQTREWLEHLKSGLARILKGETDPFLDEELMKKLPTASDQLISNKKNTTFESIIEKTCDALQHGNPKIRNAASQALVDVIDKLFLKNRIAEILQLSNRLIPWIKSNAQLTPSYHQIFNQLKELTVKLIHEKRFSDCNHILETFNLIAGGRIQKNTATLNLSAEILEEIAAEKEIKAFLLNLKAGDKKQKKQITYSLAMLGTPAIERLLDILRDSQDAYERGDILYVLTKIGHLEVSAIADRLKNSEPWYYIRNLVLLIGRVGTRDHLSTLKRFMDHEDFRVKDEVITGILNIGGVEGKNFIFSLLSAVEDQLKIKTISKLGDLKIKEATPHLLEMLKSKALEHSELKDKIDEKICLALGSIGSQEAIPVLGEIVGQKGLLQRKAHSESVKAAAKKALEMLEPENPQTT